MRHAQVCRRTLISGVAVAKLMVPQRRPERGGLHRFQARFIPPASIPEHFQALPPADPRRSEEHTSGLQSLMRISYAVFRLKKKKNRSRTDTDTTPTNQKKSTCHKT